jgi:hypothetical protein
MKARFALILALVVTGTTLLANEPSAPSTEPKARAVRVRTVYNNGWEIVRGMNAPTLINQAGPPAERLSDDVWVYSGFGANGRHPELRRCTNLVVTFVKGVVVDLHLVCDGALPVLANRAQNGSPLLVAEK